MPTLVHINYAACHKYACLLDQAVHLGACRRCMPTWTCDPPSRVKGASFVCSLSKGTSHTPYEDAETRCSLEASEVEDMPFFGEVLYKCHCGCAVCLC